MSDETSPQSIIQQSPYYQHSAMSSSSSSPFSNPGFHEICEQCQVHGCKNRPSVIEKAPLKGYYCNVHEESFRKCEPSLYVFSDLRSLRLNSYSKSYRFKIRTFLQDMNGNVNYTCPVLKNPPLWIVIAETETGFKIQARTYFYIKMNRGSDKKLYVKFQNRFWTIKRLSTTTRGSCKTIDHPMDDRFTMEDRKSSRFQQLISDTNDFDVDDVDVASPRSEGLPTPPPMSILTDASHNNKSEGRNPIEIVQDILEVGNNLEILFNKMIQQEKNMEAKIADLEEDLKKEKVKLIEMESNIVKLKSWNSLLRSENVWLNHMVNKHVFVRLDGSLP